MEFIFSHTLEKVCSTVEQINQQGLNLQVFYEERKILPIKGKNSTFSLRALIFVSVILSVSVICSVRLSVCLHPSVCPTRPCLPMSACECFPV